MLITVFGATGQVGRRIVSQALQAGHSVRAFGRNTARLIDEDMRNNQLEAIQGYVFDEAEVLDAVEGADAVLSALGGAFDGTDKTRSLGIRNIAAQMEKAGVKRIIALGGYGVLEAPGGGFLIDQPGYPEQYIPVGREHLQAYLNLKETSLDYTFICSPDILDEDGRGAFVTSADYPPVPNHFKIAAGDIARFMLEELQDNRFIQKRAGISLM
jgi:putative NADH-flavin reductase